MENQTVRKFKWFWAWQDDKEEAWLSEMAQAGWHMKWPPFLVSTPSRPVHREMMSIGSISLPQIRIIKLLQLFQDAGWVHLGSMGGWQYFRKTRQGGEAPRSTPIQSRKCKSIAGYSVSWWYSSLSICPSHQLAFGYHPPHLSDWEAAWRCIGDLVCDRHD